MLKGKTAIVTGSSKGIGREIALALAENGADLVINGNNQEQLEHVKAQICLLYTSDVYKRQDKGL